MQEVKAREEQASSAKIIKMLEEIATKVSLINDYSESKLCKIMKDCPISLVEDGIVEEMPEYFNAIRTLLFSIDKGVTDIGRKIERVDF